ncbi:MAG: TonB-dependent receptor plug domain-containing protein, partial [bacterium]|nr:TonB-dependent receptor plug domain-containing protein [bacterium]
MKKNLFLPLAGLIVLAFLFSFVVNTPLLAQEKEEEVEDVMDMALEDLLNVEITTAGKTAEKISDIPASVVLVTRDDIEKYGYQTLAEVLENIPGLYQTDDYYAKNFGVRGFWTVDPQRNVIVLVNDVRQTEGIWNGRWLEQMNIPVEAIDRIEVVRGPMSVIYGTGAFFGVINIITNQVSENAPGNLLSVAFGSENTKKVALRASGKSGDFTYAFNGSYFDTEGLDSDLAKMGGAPGTSTKGQMEKEEKYFNFSGKFKNFSFDASYTEGKHESNFLISSFDEGTNVVHRATRVAFGYDGDLSEKVRLTARLGYSHTRKNYDYDWLWPGFVGNQAVGSSGLEA